MIESKVQGRYAADVAAAAEAAVAASGVALSTGGGTNWRPETEFDPDVATEVIKTRSIVRGS